MTMLAETIRVEQRGAFDRADRIWPMPLPLRRVPLLGPPLLLAGLEIVHPRPDENHNREPCRWRRQKRSWKEFTEPVVLSSTQPAGLPIPRRS